MFKHATVKKSLILLVAALVCVAVFLSACGEKPFTPNFDAPKGLTVESNGGIAVKYGDYVYYVNGYESDPSADNTYVDVNDAPRIGSVLRISIADLKKVLAINEDEDLTNSQKTENIADAVRDYAEVVVPKIYYSNNTETARLNGIFIFNDRLYMLTPNDKLTAGGDTQTDQSVLMSFDLNGANPERHFTFTTNTAQVKLYEKDNKVMATYLMSSKLHVLDVAAGKDTQVTNDDETAGSVKFVEDGNRLFFINADGAICQLVDGETSAQVVVQNNKDWEIAYTISSVVNEYVYYTVTYDNNPDLSGAVLYYATYNETVAQTEYETEDEYAATRKVAYYDPASISSAWTGWKEDKLVIVQSDTFNNDTYYGIYISYVTKSADDELAVEQVRVLQEGFNDSSITINKIVGDTLYYTAGNVTYVKDLSKFVENGAIVENKTESQSFGTPYAASLSTTTTGWALSDIVTVTETVDGETVTHTYMFSLSSNSVSVVEFNSEKKTNSTAAALTLTAKTED